METKAHYVAVGGFVMLAALALVVILMWFMGVSGEAVDHYEADFTGSVSGLSKGTSVRYNGIDIGHVTNLLLDKHKPNVVRVILDIKQGTPIHVDSKASIESEGLAGGAFLLITGGSPTTGLIKPGTREHSETEIENGDYYYPAITAQKSSLEQLFTNTPQLMADLSQDARLLRRWLAADNAEKFSNILAQMSDVADSIAAEKADIHDTIAKLHEDMSSLGTLLGHADIAAVSANGAIGQINKLVTTLNEIIGNSKAQLSQLTGQGAAQLTQLIGEMRVLVASLTRLSNSLERDPSRLLTGSKPGGYRPQ